jgi:hypothetical protein
MSDLTLRLCYEDLPLARRHLNTTVEVFTAGGANHFRILWVTGLLIIVTAVVADGLIVGPQLPTRV